MEKRSKVPVVSCGGCGLVQFWPEGKTHCVRPGCRHEITWRLTARLKLENVQPIGEKSRFFDGKAFNRRLRGIRRGLKLSQTQLARRLATSRTYISRTERDSIPTLSGLERYAGALGISVDCLLNEFLSIRDLVELDREALISRERFVQEIAQELPRLKPEDRAIVLEAAQAMAKGQYTSPEWMTV